jgi:hypothetical protein
MTIITAYSNRSKAVLAYIAPIENGQANTHKAIYGKPATHQDNAIFFVLCLMEEVNAHDLYATFKGELNV